LIFENGSVYDVGCFRTLFIPTPRAIFETFRIVPVPPKPAASSSRLQQWLHLRSSPRHNSFFLETDQPVCLWRRQSALQEMAEILPLDRLHLR
jgi:hypothetical protein